MTLYNNHLNVILNYMFLILFFIKIFNITALALAAEKKNIEIAKLLLTNKKINVEYKCI